MKTTPLGRFSSLYYDGPTVGLIRELNPYKGGGAGIRKPSKFFLNNTTLMHTMQQYLGQPILKGTERAIFHPIVGKCRDSYFLFR